MRRRLSTINQNIAEILASTTPSKTTLRTIRLHFHYNVAECGESFGAIGGGTRKMTRVKFRLSFSDGTFRCELPDVHQTQSLEEPRKYLWKVVNDSLHFPLSSYNKYSGVGWESWGVIGLVRNLEDILLLFSSLSDYFWRWNHRSLLLESSADLWHMMLNNHWRGPARTWRINLFRRIWRSCLVFFRPTLSFCTFSCLHWTWSEQHKEVSHRHTLPSSG